jgi:hypothetical protein
MPRQQHWFACTLDGSVVTHGRRKRDVLDSLDALHPQVLGMSGKTGPGFYPVEYPGEGSYLVLNEDEMGRRGWRA